MKELAKYEAARAAIAAARNADEILQIRDRARALSAAAQIANDHELEANAGEIRLRAERRLGEMLLETKKAKGGLHKGGRPGRAAKAPAVPKLAEVGIDHKLSSRAQKLAAVPAKAFEKHVTAFRAEITEASVKVSRRLVHDGEKALKRGIRTATVHDGGTVKDLHALADSGARFGCIMADPPWEFRTYSEKGKDRNASQHYQTMNLAALRELPIERLAAPDCVLILWKLSTMPLEALDLIEAWGFTHKTTAFTWAKSQGDGWFMGTGYWTRANPEEAWLATRGKPKRLHADVRELIVAPVGAHSEKPARIHKDVERLAAGPYLELFGRKPVAGWTVWGNQVPFAGARHE